MEERQTGERHFRGSREGDAGWRAEDAARQRHDTSKADRTSSTQREGGR